MKKALAVPERHQLKIALDTIRMSTVGASIMGGMDHRQAIAFLRKVGFTDENIRVKLEDAGHSEPDIKALLAIGGSMFSQETLERYCTLLDEKIIHIWESAAASKGEDLYPWTPYPITRAKKIWRDYMRFGFVRDERGVEDMVENFIDKIVTLDASTTLLGHTPQNPQEIIEGFELAYFESIHDHLCDYMCDKDGTHYISDYGLKPLQEIAGKLLDASTVEEKLLLLDRVLNVVHQRSDLASWFVRGGRAMLDELSNEEHLCAI